MEKILYIASTYDHIKKFHLPYINALKKEGFKVDILASGEEADFNVRFKKSILSFKNFKEVKNIRKIILEGKYKNIIVNTTLAAFFVRLAIRKKDDINLINIVHGYLFDKKTNFIKKNILLFCEKINKRKTTSIITMNRYDYGIAKKYKLCKKGIYFIDGIGVNEMQKTNAVPFELKNKYLLYSAELSNRKNQIFVLESMKDIIKECSDIRLVLIGKGKEEKKLKKYISRNGLVNYVYMPGYINNPYFYYKNCSIYISSSKSEGLPFNIVNALQFNKLVIASNVKGNNDIIKNEINGLLFDNKKEFVSLIINAYNNNVSFDKLDETYKKYSLDNVFYENYNLILHLLNDK